MASNLTVDTLTKGATTLNTDELVDVNNTRVLKAWVNFNGSGVVATRASFNVSSIVDDGVGIYTINFTTAMPDADYAVVGVGHQVSADHVVANVQSTADQLSSSVKIHVTNYNGGNVDPDILSLMIAG